MEDDEEVTPQARDFLRDVKDIEVEPYETPVVLKKPKRQAQVIEDSDAETHTSKVPIPQLDMDGKNRRKPTTHSVRLPSERVCQCNVMCDLIDNIVPFLAHCQIYQSGGCADEKASNSISHI